MTMPTATILVVDDNQDIRIMLKVRLERQGHAVHTVADGRLALEWLAQHSADLILLDIMMPEMNGFEVLQHLKADDRLRHIPVIVLSAMDDIDSVVRCIQLGAEDHLSKPFNRVLLKARIEASLQKKRFRDQEQAYLSQIQAEREKSERLLLNILPAPIAERLKGGEQPIADYFDEVTILFADMVGFTEIAGRTPPTELVNMLSRVFSTFDLLVEKYGLEKIKTIGDAYMAAGGLPTPRPDHAEAIADLALDMQAAVAAMRDDFIPPLRIRIGIHSGPVVAGVIGDKKFAYDLWGDTVNVASRMESQGDPQSIQLSEATVRLLGPRYLLQEKGVVSIKGKGEMTTYFLKGKRNAGAGKTGPPPPDFR